jgi:hypothetical protein
MRRNGTDRLILNDAQGGMIVWSETALLTITLTLGRRPETADIVKLVEP